MSICITLGHMLSKGVQTACEDIKQKRVDKREARRRQIERDMDLYGTYPIIQPDHDEQPSRKSSLKKKLSRRWKSRGQEHNNINQLTFERQLTPYPDYDHQRPPQRSARDMGLGISTEGSASAEVRADRHRRRVQRMNDYALAVSLVRARRHMIEQYECVEPPPAYNPDEPRLPTYQELRSSDDGPISESPRYAHRVRRL